MRWGSFVYAALSTSSVSLSADSFPLIGEAMGMRIPKPPLKGEPWCVQINKTSPQKGADQQIQPAPSIDCKYSKATSCKFGTPVSGGAYQNAREVTPEWNDA